MATSRQASALVVDQSGTLVGLQCERYHCHVRAAESEAALGELLVPVVIGDERVIRVGSKP